MFRRAVATTVLSVLVSACASSQHIPRRLDTGEPICGTKPVGGVLGAGGAAITGLIGTGLLVSNSSCDRDELFGDLTCDTARLTGILSIAGAVALTAVSFSSFQRAEACNTAIADFRVSVAHDPAAPTPLRDDAVREQYGPRFLPYCVAANHAIRVETDPEKRLALIRAAPSECLR